MRRLVAMAGIVGLVAVWNGVAVAEPGCLVRVCDNGEMSCEDVDTTDVAPDLGSGGGKVTICKVRLEEVPCLDVPECPRYAPAVSANRLSFVALALAASGAFIVRRRKRSA